MKAMMKSKNMSQGQILDFMGISKCIKCRMYKVNDDFLTHDGEMRTNCSVCRDKHKNFINGKKQACPHCDKQYTKYYIEKHKTVCPQKNNV
jgi:hypothetical protein